MSSSLDDNIRMTEKNCNVLHFLSSLWKNDTFNWGGGVN